MSNGSQSAVAIAYAPRLFEADSSLTPHSAGATAVSSPSVLLVGRNGSWGTLVLKSLARFGSELSFAAPETVTSKVSGDDGPVRAAGALCRRWCRGVARAGARCK